MSRDRFFVDGVHAVGERIALLPDDARKLVTVLRRQGGERIELVDAAGTAFEAVLSVEGKTVHATLDRRLPTAEYPAARIVVAQAIPKGQKMDFIVEKATELGVSAIVPFRSARVIGARMGEHKHERWERIARTAAQQSGRLSIPRVEPVADWGELLATFGAYDRVYIAWEGSARVPLRDRFEPDRGNASAVLIIIGPEGGFASGEVDRAAAAGAVAISLGTRILRTETAALVVLAALLYARGEL